MCSLLFAYHTFRPLTDDEIRLECRQKLGPRKVHVVLPASNSSPRFCRSLSTLLIHNYEPTLINWNGETHHSSKIFKLLEYLQTNTSAKHEHSLNLPPQCEEERGDIVISMDAYDVLTQRPLESVIEQFEQVPAKIVYSAEKGCHPPNEDWCKKVPDSPLPHNYYGPRTDREDLRYSRPRFLNSGFVIGYAKDLLALYSDAAASATSRKGHFNADQSIFGPLYVSGLHNMTLDWIGTMSTPYFFFEEEVGAQPIPMDNPARNHSLLRDEVPWTLFNRVTGQFPAFVHFNGDKNHMDQQWSRLWFGGGQGMPVMQRIHNFLNSDNVSIPLDNGVSLPFHELCPGLWQTP